jgi:hypothetical protein
MLPSPERTDRRGAERGRGAGLDQPQARLSAEIGEPNRLSGSGIRDGE